MTKRRRSPRPSPSVPPEWVPPPVANDHELPSEHEPSFWDAHRLTLVVLAGPLLLLGLLLWGFFTWRT